MTFIERPLPRLSKPAVRKALDEARADFEWCWKTFHGGGDLSADDGTRGVDLLSYQARLVKAVWNLERFIRAIKKAKLPLESDPGRYNRAYRKARLKALASYDHALRECVGTGRALGDAFAWIFYERDRELISEHLKEQMQAMLPQGVGGFGERLLTESMKSLDGRLLLYHGITSFLRIGDVSFVDVESMRVHAIGEVKTKDAGENKLEIGVHMVAAEMAHLPRPPVQPSVKRQSVVQPLPPLLEERLGRQKKRMGAVMQASRKALEETAAIAGEMPFYFDELAKAVQQSRVGRMELVPAGPAMVIGVIRCRKGTSICGLSKTSGDLNKVLADVPAQATGILVSGWSDNSIWLDDATSADKFVVTDESLPPGWWPLEPEVLHDILFGQVMVITIYNPAHLSHLLEGQGFSRRTVNGKELFERRLDNGRLLQLQNMTYFHRFVTRSFMSLDGVLKMILQGIDATLAQGQNYTGPGQFKAKIMPKITTSRAASRRSPLPRNQDGSVSK